MLSVFLSIHRQGWHVGVDQSPPQHLVLIVQDDVLQVLIREILEHSEVEAVTAVNLIVNFNGILLLVKLHLPRDVLQTLDPANKLVVGVFQVLWEKVNCFILFLLDC